MQEFKQKSSKEFVFHSTKHIQSSACVVECFVCGKGISDGYTITAKTLPSGIVMFCNVHYR